MTLGLGQWLARFGLLSGGGTGFRKPPYVDLGTLGPRDLCDLNLPPGVAGGLQARQDAEDLRRRIFW